MCAPEIQVSRSRKAQFAEVEKAKAMVTAGADSTEAKGWRVAALGIDR